MPLLQHLAAMVVGARSRSIVRSAASPDDLLAAGEVTSIVSVPTGWIRSAVAAEVNEGHPITTIEFVRRSCASIARFAEPALGQRAVATTGTGATSPAAPSSSAASSHVP
jgi:hypothetical protein